MTAGQLRRTDYEVLEETNARESCAPGKTERAPCRGRRAARFALFSGLWFALASGATAEAPSGDRRPDHIHEPEAPFSSFPTPAFDATGRLWLAFVEGDFIYVTSSDDGGRTFALAVPVNREGEKIDANGEGRPKIAAAKDGTLLVSWTWKLEKPYSGLIRFSRSTDGGKSFTPPVTLNDDGLETGHRFDALAVAPSGAILVAWIDKRDLERARSEGKPYTGAAIYVAVSRDGGRTFEPNRKVKDNVCVCCRLSFAFDENGEASLLFRDIVDGGIRDHVLAKRVEESEPPAIAKDDAHFSDVHRERDLDVALFLRVGIADDIHHAFLRHQADLADEIALDDVLREQPLDPVEGGAELREPAFEGEAPLHQPPFAMYRTAITVMSSDWGARPAKDFTAW
jgi:hypothetical protein